MDHLHSFIYMFNQVNDSTRPGLISIFVTLFTATFAFVSAFFTLSNLHIVQVVLAILASIVALVSGGFAIRFYRLQIRKLKNNA